MKSSWLLAFIIFLFITILLYHPFLGFPPTREDTSFIEEVHNAESFSTYMEHRLHKSELCYRPVRYLVLYPLLALTNGSDLAFSIITVLFHMMNALLLMKLLRDLSFSSIACWGTSLLFLANIAHSVQPLWLASGVTTGLSFFLIGFILTLRGLTQHSWWKLIIALLSISAALLSYEGFICSFFILLYTIIYFHPHISSRRITKFAVGSIVLLYIAYIYQQIFIVPSEWIGTNEYTLGSYTISAFTIMFVRGFTPWYSHFYHPLSFDYVRSEIMFRYPYYLLHTLFPLYALSLWILHARKVVIKDLMFSLIWIVIFIVPFLPFSGIEPRHLYLSSAGTALAAVMILERVLRLCSCNNRYLLVFLNLLCGFGYITFYAQLWRVAHNHIEWYAHVDDRPYLINLREQLTKTQFTTPQEVYGIHCTFYPSYMEKFVKKVAPSIVFHCIPPQQKFDTSPDSPILLFLSAENPSQSALVAPNPSSLAKIIADPHYTYLRVDPNIKAILGASDRAAPQL